MANSSISQAVNRATVAQALWQARIQAAEHQAWLNAVNKAALELASEQWIFDGETLVIGSATTPGSRYHATAHRCECRAFARGIPYWHRAAARLLQKAAEVAELQQAAQALAEALRKPARIIDRDPNWPAARPQGKTFAEIQADVDALY